MDKTQADAIAQAILEPDVRKQDVVRRKRAIDAQQVSRERQIAWFVLIGFAVGGTVAYFTGERTVPGGIWGGIAGSATGRFVVWLRRKSRST